MTKAAVLGDSESVKGFAAVGLDSFPVDDPAQAPVLLRRLMNSGDYDILFITEALVAAVDKEMKQADDRIVPAIIPIPGVRGNTGVGVQRLRDAVERAVGSDIVFGG